MKLTAKSYPTNAPSKTEYNNLIFDKRKIHKETKTVITGGKNSEIFEIQHSGNDFNILEFKKSIPDRFNVEFNYSINGTRHPTDIADGIKTCYQPRKINHWGHGISKNEYETYIFIANYSNNSKERLNEKIKLTIFSNSTKIQKKINIPFSSYQVIKLKNLRNTINSNYFSWYLLAKQVNLNIYWL